MSEQRPSIAITRGLVEALLSLAADAEPREVSVGLAVTPAAELIGDDAATLDPETPVFTDLYIPEAGRSVSAVFGVNLGTPPRRTQGRFVSHPEGELRVQQTDDLHETLLVAIPPWTPETMAAFSRRGVELPLVIVDAEPPAEVFE